MPGYRYDSPWVNPYAPSIAEILEQPGRVEAQRATAIANAQARAAEIKGQAWGRGVEQAAQIAAAIPQQIDRQRDDAQLREARQIDIDTATAKRAIGALTLKHTETTPDGHVVYDIPGFAADAQQDPTVAALAPDHVKAMQSGNDTYQTWKEGRFATKQAALQGIYAKAAEAGGTSDAFETIAFPFAKAGVLDESDLAPMYRYLQQIPDQAGRVKILNAAAGVKPQILQHKADEDVLAVSPGAAPEVMIKGTPQPKTQAELAVDAANANSPTRAQSQAALDALQAPAKQTAARADAALTEAERHNRAMEARPVAGAAGAVEGNFDATGDEFLKSIPAAWRQTVKKIANYEEDPTKVASMRGGMREKLTQWVNQYNPAYDQSSFAIRNPTRKAFTIGPQGQQVTAINTAVEHLDLLQQAADALANGSFKPGNALYNRVRDAFGSAMPSNYDTIKDMVDHEVGSVASKGVPTVSDVASQNKRAGTSASPAAIKGYIDTLIPLMGSKLNALHYQYQQAMGPNDPWKPLTPQTEAILQRRGVQMSPHPDNDTKGTTGAPVLMIAPDGSTALVAADHVEAAKAKGAKVK